MPTQVCTTCDERKDINEFAIRRGEVRQRSCKLCKRKYNEIWYEKNRTRHRQSVRKNNARAKAAARKLSREARDVPCMDCNKRYGYWVMQFDHRDSSTKIDSVSALAGSSCSLERVKEEIAKCDVVCANCHADRTHRRRSRSSVG